MHLMAQHKKQHYIPKSYLKEWCDPNIPQNYSPYLWIIDKYKEKFLIRKKYIPKMIY